MKDERMFNDEIGRAFLLSYVGELVPFLPGWKLNQIDSGVYLQLDSRRKYLFYFSKGKVVASPRFPDGNYPKWYGVDGEREDVRFSRHRKPRHVANQLAKVIPEYLRLYDECMKAVEAARALNDKRQHIVDLLTREYGHSASKKGCGEYAIYTPFGKLTIHRRLDVSVSLYDLPTDVVFPILEAIRNAAK